MFDGLPLAGFLATGPDSINFAKNLAIPRPVALIPSCCNLPPASCNRCTPWASQHEEANSDTSEPTASLSLVAVTTMDVASMYVRITRD